jgi:multiple sugar transport system permease protein
MRKTVEAERPAPHREEGKTGARQRHFWDSEKWLAVVMIAPAILYIACMVGFPLVLAILYSLSDATTGDPSLHLVGLKNFRDILQDPVFRKSLGNTFIFTLVSQTLVIIFSQALAMALAKEFRGKWLARFFILLPWTAPIALGTIGWLWMLDSIFSPFDWMLREAGWEPSAGCGCWTPSSARLTGCCARRVCWGPRTRRWDRCPTFTGWESRRWP